MAGFSYKAFISYSHEDEHWARWLQRALETYRVPKRLVGEQGNYGNIPPRLAPVFRDRVDLSPGADLTESVRHELAAAETMVVICSPSAAQSRWVNEEIMAFRALGRADRIYALIVDGDPQTTDPAEQCFPKALIENEDGELLEPLAADARKWADGKLLAKLKLVAGILGARLDEIFGRLAGDYRILQILNAAQDGAHTGSKLKHTKWFGEIVIGTGLKAQNTIELSRLGCQHQDRLIRALSTHGPANLQPIRSGKA